METIRARQRGFDAGFLFFMCVALLVLSPVSTPGQTKESPAPAPDTAAIKHQVSDLRDAFVKDVQAAGFKCPIAPPTIEVRDVASFGNYDPEHNTLTTAAWDQLSDAEKGIFLRNRTEAAAREEFEIGVHHWVLAHELGHWWQACNGLFNDPDHFEMELAANRIAAAYWRKNDPSIVTHQRGLFDSIARRWPNPVPAGEDWKAYFNSHYEQLAPTPAYIWFQARMCLTAIDENPTPTFLGVLKQIASKP